jgi:hypothetical protein
VSSISNGLYFLTLPLVSAMRVIYTSKGMSKKFWGARYTLGVRYLSKNTIINQCTRDALKEKHLIFSQSIFIPKS